MDRRSIRGASRVENAAQVMRSLHAALSMEIVAHARGRRRPGPVVIAALAKMR